MDWFWKYSFDQMLQPLLQNGSLHIVMPDGEKRIYGDATGKPILVRIHNMATVRKLALSPELALGEAYTNGSLTIDGDDLQSFLAMLVLNVDPAGADRVWWQKPVIKMRAILRGLKQNNMVPQARRNVAHHYDLSGQLYDLFLDESRQYSCAYFKEKSDTLEQAQAQKIDHITRKLLIEPGMRVLDIGCGWGGMAMTLAQDYGANVVGITLSKEQHAFATERAKQAGLSDRVEIRLCDYRNIEEYFDRIVSVGMFEHVGLRHFDEYFTTLRNRLSPEGIALVHTIGWSRASKDTNPWIAKHIFPGGYVPSVSETMAAVEKAQLWATDIECWRLHYAYTLRQWYDRFIQNQDVARNIYDDQFVRMWRFYLAASEQTFRHGYQAVYQFQLSRKIDAVPLTRDYLYLRPDQTLSPLVRKKRKPDLVTLSGIPAPPNRKRRPAITPHKGAAP
ncbi:SAM-dependent methyltransferase [Falsihalocynthiibacter arcticus]|uniref:SAM-dependent methyltransferase n=1 Tax=Falsihalocynthiibacter arcticus TaxID=1579316 RepID=UPI0009ED32AE|nr:cyclopropane-fatty-acyl-phospholipid synthase family protein [Falsihalocynthiibacter arcticus]